MTNHYKVQSVILSREYFGSPREAREWIQGHGYRYSPPDITPQYYRFRQIDPKALEHTHRFRSVELKGVGYLILAYPK
jgi:hypothetical protein